MKRQWLVLWSLWAARLVRQPTLPVRVTGGWLRGQVAADGTHLSYTGIPYASSPKRFQVATSTATWEGVLEATDEHVRCAQRFTDAWVVGTEDCLTVNVYTPVRGPTGKLKPVMLYIHGGGFRDGSGSPFLYGPKYLIRHDVILVTFNYRLEVLGFLCLGIDEAPGNAGLKDQLEALRWVKKNIKAFGGDPTNVTLFGVSAGGASVLFHMTSPMSKGLFQKAIMQSGSAISPWSLQFEPLKIAILLAKQMGYNLKDPRELYELFKGISIQKLLSTRVPRQNGDVVLSENIFVPCIENNVLPDEDKFVRDAPYSVINTGHYNKVPVMLGYTNAEGYMFVGKENATTIRNFNFLDSMPRDLLFPTDMEKNDTAKKLRKLYPIETTDSDLLVKLSKYEGDSGIAYPVTVTADILTKTMNYPVYAYKFCYDGWMNLLKIAAGFFKYPGATHADDIFYIFNSQIILPQVFFEKRMINKITTMWTNFAKYGIPIPDVTEDLPMKWYPIRKKDPELLIFNRQFSTEALYKDRDLLFWNQTYTKYRRKT